MKVCECLAGCPFFHDVMANMPISSQLMKAMYCRDDNTHCARFMVFKTLGKQHVPLTLFPDQTEVAEKLINETTAEAAIG